MRFDAYANLYSNAPKGSASNDLQTPWVMKLLSGGQIADKMSYYMYFLLTERGEVAGLEDAYVQFTNVGGSPLSLIVGQFQVSDPLFKRELRLTYDDYQAYRVRVGNAKADLTYDRGVMAVWSPWEGADMAASVVSGRGLNQADDERKYDSDSDKNFAFRYSQEIGHLRLGGYVYGGNERQLGRNNRITIFGPDATLSLTSKVELNLQYVTRKDDDPFYGACSVSAPCAGTRTKPFGTTVRSGFVEATISPQGPAGKMFFSGLYNWASSDDQVISLRLGEQGTPPGLLSEYRTASFAVHRMHHRNVRMTAEAQWDFTNERARLLTGFVVGF
ncbi:MAG: hypothetical protein FJ202_07555 [Gemmatimonadetes bacterium]|nr:hypothetical protein [Gemmatimonadota bacterium]